jgi:hypothetical protein
MASGYNYTETSKEKISDFFAPAYLLLALGLDYKPNSHFSAFIAPVTGRFTFVNNDSLSNAGAFGVKPGKKSLTELGGYMRFIYTKNDFKGDFMKNISFTTKLDLFSNYLDKPQNVVIDWETLIGMKVNKYISASINTELVYDDKIKTSATVGPKIQFKEILGAGLSCRF